MDRETISDTSPISFFRRPRNGINVDISFRCFFVPSAISIVSSWGSLTSLSSFIDRKVAATTAPVQTKPIIKIKVSPILFV